MDTEMMHQLFTLSRTNHTDTYLTKYRIRDHIAFFSPSPVFLPSVLAYRYPDSFSHPTAPSEERWRESCHKTASTRPSQACEKKETFAYEGGGKASEQARESETETKERCRTIHDGLARHRNHAVARSYFLRVAF